MSVFDYFWNIEMDKDGISFSDAIKMSQGQVNDIRYMRSDG